MDTRVHEHHIKVIFTHHWRDLFRKRYRLRCWTCDLDLGPFE